MEIVNVNFSNYCICFHFFLIRIFMPKLYYLLSRPRIIQLPYVANRKLINFYTLSIIQNNRFVKLLKKMVDPIYIRECETMLNDMS